MQTFNCKFCGSHAHYEWGDSSDDQFRVECAASTTCKQWPILYANTKTHAVKLWNLMMGPIGSRSGRNNLKTQTKVQGKG